jgi:hypothetical protein
MQFFRKDKFWPMTNRPARYCRYELDSSFSPQTEMSFLPTEQEKKTFLLDLHIEAEAEAAE